MELTLRDGANGEPRGECLFTFVRVHVPKRRNGANRPFGARIGAYIGRGWVSITTGLRRQAGNET